MCSCFYNISAQPAKDDEIELPKLGENGKLFIHIRNLWLQKNHHALLSLMDARVRLNFGVTEQGLLQTYAAEQAAGILKEHFADIKILKFSYIHKRILIDTGVAYYQYQIQKNGIIKNKMLYFYLKQKIDQKPEEKIWVIHGINQIDCKPLSE